MRPGAAESAWSALRRWPDAIAIKKTVLIVSSLSEASARGSNTPGRLHAGRSFRAGGRFRKKARIKPLRDGAIEIHEPSAKPVWKAAIADLYPRIVEIERPLSKRAIKKNRPRPSEVPNGETPRVIRTN